MDWDPATTHISHSLGPCYRRSLTPAYEIDRDLLVATDDERYKTRTLAPLVPLCDGAGVVESVNAEEGSPSRWRPGDRVLVAAGSSWKSAEPGTDGELDGTRMLGAGDVDGVLQQYFVADEDAIVPAPDGLSFEEAAVLGGAYVSAWNALFGWYKPLKAGDVVVTQGTGGVSTAVLQVSISVAEILEVELASLTHPTLVYR